MSDLQIPEGVPKRRGKALLVFPPQWSPQNPHFSLRALMGHLRSQGIEVAVRDLNVEYYDTVLDPHYLRRTAKRIRLDREYLAARAILNMASDEQTVDDKLEALRYGAIKRYLDQKGHLLDQLPDLIADAKETLRDARRFYNPDLLVEAFHIIDQALEMVSLPYYPAQLSFNYFEQPDCLLSVNSLIDHATKKSYNLFYDYFEKRLPGMLAENPDYIGISINSFSQVVPGLTLAYLLKKAAPEGCHVSIGGNFFSRVQETLSKRPDFFQTFAHSVVTGEGEHLLVELVDVLANKRPLSEVSNLLYLSEDEATVLSTSSRKPPKLDELGIQDLAGLPLEKYFTPEMVLTIQASKGCYWGKCTFCDTDFGVRVDTKRVDRLIDEMKHLRDSYGIKHFQFIDEAIRPTYMRKMAQRFIDEDLGIHWFSNGRLDSAITEDLLQLCHDSGLRMVLWGFESGSDRILKLIEKGVDVDKRYDILSAGNKAGIWNFAYIFFGFPTETTEEALSTIDAICDHRDIIHSYGRSVFTLGKQAPLYLEAEKLGIVDIMEDVEELSTNLHYRMTKGMTDAELDRMLKVCTQRCLEAYDQNLWFFLRYRENIHLYVTKYGLDYVKSYRMTRYVAPSTCEEIF